MIVIHLCDRPDITIVQHQLFKFIHVREGRRTLGVGHHFGDHVGDHVGDGVHQGLCKTRIMNIYLIMPCAAQLIEVIQSKVELSQSWSNLKISLCDFELGLDDYNLFKSGCGHSGQQVPSQT